MVDRPAGLERLHQNDWESYEQMYDEFEWELPESFNIAQYACEQWADDKSRVAMFYEDAEGNEKKYTFWELDNASSQLANYLKRNGIEKGDRVAVSGPPKPEPAIAFYALWKLGAVVVPLSTGFGPKAISYRVSDSDSKIFICDSSNIDAFREEKDNIDTVSQTILFGDEPTGDDEVGFWEALNGESKEISSIDTARDSPATITYTSGTTGDPKGTVTPHQYLLGNIPGTMTTVCSLDIQDNSVFWSPAEYAWIAGLFDELLFSHNYGRPVLAYSGGPFNAIKTFELLEKYGVTNAIIPPTAIRMMREKEDAMSEYDLSEMSVVMSGGELVGEEVVKWTEEAFGVDFNTAYGQTEASKLTGECGSLLEHKPGTIGKPAPGHEIEILDPETLEPLEPGEVGEIAVKYEGDPLCFSEYWNLPEKTDEKIRDGWMLTEDLGKVDEDGFFFFDSRKDDVIISSGYRIGPEEIEDTLSEHAKAADAGVIGVPDETRGEVPKAFVRVSERHEPSEGLKQELKDYVRDELARYKYPREIEFINELPTTPASGKLKRNELREREGL